MEEETMTLNESAEVENSEDNSSISETEATEEAELDSTKSTEDVDEEDEETDGGSKKGYSNRVRELNQRAKKAEAEKESLAQKLKALTGATEPSYSLPRNEEPLAPLVQPGEEIDSVEFEKRLQQREQKILERADALVTLRGRQQEAINRINVEAEKTLQRYPELDPDSDSYNKELSDAITEATEVYVTNNPYTASVSNFVDKMMRPYKGAVSKGVGDMVGNMTKQVSEAAIRPTSVRKQERPAAEKSIAELERELGIVQA